MSCCHVWSEWWKSIKWQQISGATHQLPIHLVGEQLLQLQRLQRGREAAVAATEAAEAAEVAERQRSSCCCYRGCREGEKLLQLQRLHTERLQRGREAAVAAAAAERQRRRWQLSLQPARDPPSLLLQQSPFILHPGFTLFALYTVHCNVMYMLQSQCFCSDREAFCNGGVQKWF